MMKSHRSNGGIPSIRRPASKDISSASVALRETDACFLQVHEIGKSVRLPKRHNIPPDVDMESSRSPAKSESRNNPYLNLLNRVSHMTTLPEITRVVHVRNQPG